MSDFQVTVERIEKLEQIPGKDRIKLATIRGWKAIVKASDFNEGDHGVFFPPASLLPSDDDRFAFMEKTNFRVKTIRMGGVISQGLFLPMSLFPELEGRDLTQPLNDILNVTKWEPPVDLQLKTAGKQLGVFPSKYQRTDQERIQNMSAAYDELRKFKYYVSEKVDGTSLTILFEPGQDIRVCSRNFMLEEEEDNLYWRMARKMFPKIDYTNVTLPFCIQGEIIGPGIQGNPYKLKDIEFRLFDVQVDGMGYSAPIGYRNNTDVEYPVFLQRNLGYAPTPECFKVVPEIAWEFELPPTLDELIEYTRATCKESTICKGVLAEGLVFKTLYRETVGTRAATFVNDIVHFKCINNDWLIAKDE